LIALHDLDYSDNGERGVRRDADPSKDFKIVIH
jgi:hypothetical protein